MPTRSDDPLNIATDAAALLLEAGGETYRAEDCVVRLCAAWDLKGVECFAMPTGLIASVNGAGTPHSSIVRRIHSRSVDLERIAVVSALIARAEDGRLDSLSCRMAIDDLRSAPAPRLLSTLCASALCALFFTLLFGGGPVDALAAGATGALIAILRASLARKGISDFLMYIVCGSLASAVGVLLFRLSLLETVDRMIIGSIMLLVPGLSTVTAIRDTIAGDLVAGVARLADAFITAAAISMGVVIPLAFQRLVLI